MYQMSLVYIQSSMNLWIYGATYLFLRIQYAIDTQSY